MIDALMTRVSVTYKCYEMNIGEKRCNCLMCWDRSRNGSHLINYRDCLRSLPNWAVFLFLSEFVNEAGFPAGIPCISFGSDIVFTLRSTEHMRERLVTSMVSCIRRKRDQIKDLQENDNSMVIFVLKRRKVVR